MLCDALPWYCYTYGRWCFTLCYGMVLNVIHFSTITWCSCIIVVLSCTLKQQHMTILLGEWPVTTQWRRQGNFPYSTHQSWISSIVHMNKFKRFVNKYIFSEPKIIRFTKLHAITNCQFYRLYTPSGMSNMTRDAATLNQLYKTHKTSIFAKKI